MDTLNYKELKKEFRKKQIGQKKQKPEYQKEAVTYNNSQNDKLHNMKRKQEYWQYLLEQKNS